MMRTGADYRETLRRDGRKVWVLGEGLVEDVTTHPATGAMVEEYVAWYDRHVDPEWQDVLIAPPTAERRSTPWAYVLPKSTDDLVGMGRSFREDAVPQRRQRHAHSGLRPPDRDGRLDRGAGAQCLGRADRQCRGATAR